MSALSQGLLLTVVAMATVSCSSKPGGGPVRVEVVETSTGYQLLRDGEPYIVRGAGMGVDDIARFVSHGGNSIRTWTTVHDYQDARSLLDKAQEHGVTVVLGLPMRPERHGFDYDDTDAVAEQLEFLRREVLEYKDHPALLAWLIGNELNHSYTNPAVFDAVNDVAEMIRELDPYHPVSTPLSGFNPEVIATVTERAPALDFLSFQQYGSLFVLPERLSELGYDKPFMVTEWGAIGYWEVERTRWGAPIELTSSKKAETFRRGHEEILAALDGQLLGSYVFLWGQKQERTPTWFGMFTEAGEETEVVDVMHYLWTGAWPENRTPRVDALRLDGKSATDSVTLEAGQAYPVSFEVTDPEVGALRLTLSVKPESDSTREGGDYEEPIADLDGWIGNVRRGEAELRALKPGKYRLFAYARDEHDHVAHANLPFLVVEAVGR